MKSISTQTPLGRTLLALRAGRMTSDQLNERFSDGTKGAYQGIQRGLVKHTQYGYELTPEGRQACPSRRQYAASAQTEKPGQQVFINPKNSSIRPFPVGQKILLALEFIAAQGSANTAEIADHFGITRQAMNSLLWDLPSNLVTKTPEPRKAGRATNRYQLADGITLDDFVIRNPGRKPKIQPPAPINQETSMQPKPKFTALMIVSVIHKKPGIKMHLLHEALGPKNEEENKKIRDMVSYCKTQNFISYDKLKDELHLGDNEIWLASNGFIQQTKPAAPAAEAKPDLQKPAAEALPEHIPHFLRADSQVTTEQVNTLADVILAESERQAMPELSDPIPVVRSRNFRCAITSDMTLMLFGLGEQAIELDSNETGLLLDFCDTVALAVPHDHRVGGATL